MTDFFNLYAKGFSPMMHVKVWCLPAMQEDELKKLFDGIVAAVVGIKELSLEDEKDLLVNFVPDMMQYGLGTEIVVEVSGLWDQPNHRAQVRAALARALGGTIATTLPDSIVEVRIDPPINPIGAVWSNRKVAS